MSSPVLLETVWLDKYKYDDAERHYQESLANPNAAQGDNLKVPIKESSSDTDKRLQHLEKENKEMRTLIKELQSQVSQLENRLKSVESRPQVAAVKVNDVHAPPKKMANSNPENEVDDDIDLFGSDDDVDEEANKLREKRLEEYSAKKSKKPQLIAKSSVVLDIKPWDDETNMAEMEKMVRNIAMDGLLWGASKLVPLAYGIKKLQIVSVVEDDKVSIEELQEAIEAFSELVQSVDIAAFNKI